MLEPSLSLAKVICRKALVSFGSNRTFFLRFEVIVYFVSDFKGLIPFEEVFDKKHLLLLRRTGLTLEKRKYCSFPLKRYLFELRVPCHVLKGSFLNKGDKPYTLVIHVLVNSHRGITWTARAGIYRILFLNLPNSFSLKQIVLITHFLFPKFIRFWHAHLKVFQSERVLFQ